MADPETESSKAAGKPAEGKDAGPGDSPPTDPTILKASGARDPTILKAPAQGPSDPTLLKAPPGAQDPTILKGPPGGASASPADPTILKAASPPPPSAPAPQHEPTPPAAGPSDPTLLKGPPPSPAADPTAVKAPAAPDATSHRSPSPEAPAAAARVGPAAPEDATAVKPAAFSTTPRPLAPPTPPPVSGDPFAPTLLKTFSSPPSPAPPVLENPPSAPRTPPGTVLLPGRAPAAVPTATAVLPPRDGTESFRPGPEHLVGAVEVLSGPVPGERCYFTKTEMFCGRRRDADIRIPNEFISRRHFVVRRTPAGHEIEDLGSTNHTRVRRRGSDRFDLTRGPTAILPGDEIRMGPVVLRFLLETGMPPAGRGTEKTAVHPPSTAPAPARRSPAALLLVLLLAGGGAVLAVLKPWEKEGPLQKNPLPPGPPPVPAEVRKFEEGLGKELGGLRVAFNRAEEEAAGPLQQDAATRALVSLVSAAKGYETFRKGLVELQGRYDDVAARFPGKVSVKRPDEALATQRRDTERRLPLVQALIRGAEEAEAKAARADLNGALADLEGMAGKARGEGWEEIARWAERRREEIRREQAPRVAEEMGKSYAKAQDHLQRREFREAAALLRSVAKGDLSGDLGRKAREDLRVVGEEADRRFREAKKLRQGIGPDNKPVPPDEGRRRARQIFLEVRALLDPADDLFPKVEREIKELGG